MAITDEELAECDGIVCGTAQHMEDYIAKHGAWPLPYVRGVYCDECNRECVVNPTVKEQAERLKVPFRCLYCFADRIEGGNA